MNTKANTQTNKIRKAIASVAVVGFGITTLFTATALASPGGGFGSSPFEPITPPSPSELSEIMLEESLELDPSIIDIILDPAPEVEIDATNCSSLNFLDVTVTNEDTSEFFRVDVSNGSVEPSAEPVFEYEEVNYEDFTGLIGSDAPDTNTSVSEFDFIGNAVLVEVYEVSAPWSPEPWEKLVFDEEVSLCDLKNELAITEATAEYEAEVAAAALAEAEAAAQAAEEAAAQAAAEAEAAAQAAAEEAAAAAEAAAVAAAEAAAQAAQAAEEAAQAAIDRANAEREAAEAALAQAQAEKELALAQAEAEAEKAKADAILAQTQADEEAQVTDEVVENSTEEGSDEELAIGEDLGENGKSGMSGAILGLIIVLGLVGVAAITGAVLNLRKQR